MKILFLTYDVPYPLNSGGKIRAYYLIKNLAKDCQITLFSYYRSEEQKKYLEELRKYCPQIYLFKRRPVWSWQNLALTFLMPFAVAGYFSPELKRKLRDEIRTGEYGLIHFESFYPAMYLPLIKKMGGKAVMGNENLEYLIYRRYSETRPRWLRWWLNLEVGRMRRFEEYLWRLADWNLQPAPEEARVVEKVTKKPCLVVPNGVDFGRYRPVEYLVNRKTIMYLGTLVYPANAEAVKFFLTEVYPKIKRRSVDVRFILVSSYEPRWLGKFLRDKSIEHVKDATTPASELFGRADVLVAPMRIASGTNIKILEAMAAGLPVVTTTVGAEGLAVQNGVDLIVVDGAQQMGEEIIRLLGNNQLRRRIGQRARELVRARYTWSKTTAELRRFYRGIGDAQN